MSETSELSTGRSPRRWRLFKLGTTFLAFFAIFLVWAVYALSNEFLKTVEIIRTRDWENPQWTVNQTEIEFLKFLTLATQAQIDEPRDLGALRQAFDIFYSRVQTLTNGDVVVPLRSVPAFAAELNVIMNFVDQTVKVIDQADAELMVALPELTATAEDISSNLRRLQVVTLKNWAEESINRRERSVQVLIRLALALATAFVLLLALLVGLGRLYRENLRRQESAIEAHARTSAAEATLRESEARLREAQRIAQLGSWEVDAQGTLLWSDETYRIFEMSPEDFDGTIASFYQRCHPEDVDSIRKAARAAWDGPSAYEVTHRIVLASGLTRTVIERAQPILDADGKTLRLVGTVQDITQRTSAEEKLRQSQKMEVVGQLTGGMAHDFNNLLAVILGNLELIRDSSDRSSDDAFIQEAIRAAERGGELTKNMLSFARQSALEPTVIDLNKLVQETKSWSSRILPANIDVEVSLLAGLWPIEVDRTLAQNALLNLLLNARDAMPEGGKLTIETSNLRIDQDYINQRGEDVDPGRYVMLAVSDTGTGIDAQTLERVFEPFFTTKPTGSGSGLGLSMVQGFVRQSGGAIRVYSEVGVGTTFKLYFKARSEVESVQTAVHADNAVTPRNEARILVAEDQPDVLRVLTTHLSNAGYHVTPAASGDIALRIWEASDAFDLLITDIVMPGTLQGPHLARELRARRADLPVVFLSGYASEALVHGNGLRIEDIRLTKPVRRAELIAAVEKALEMKEKRSV